MSSKVMFVLAAVLASAVLAGGCDSRKSDGPDAPVLASVSGYNIYADEFAEGFATSAFAARADKTQAAREYLESLIDQKLILLDAQRRDIDKAPAFLRSVERFWAQSLLTEAITQKTAELSRGIQVRDDDVRRIYEEMVKDGVTQKPLQEVYPQIKWQAEKQQQAKLLGDWIQGLRKGAAVSVDENVLKALK